MSFTVDDFHDLVRLVEERPEWRAELRRLVLTDELLALPEQFAELRAQSERQFQALLAAQQRTDERLAELAAAQQRTDDRVAQTNERLAELTVAQQRTDERLAELAVAQQRTDERVAQTNERLAELTVAQQQTANQVATLVDDVGELKGQTLEMLYRQRAAAYLSRIARRIKTLSTDELAILLDDAVDEGQLAESERDDILLADLIVQGRRRDDGTRVYLVVEISVGIGPHDVERAVHRATLLGKLGTPALAVVAGKTMTEAATRLVRTQQVWHVTNGYAVPPESS